MTEHHTADPLKEPVFISKGQPKLSEEKSVEPCPLRVSWQALLRKSDWQFPRTCGQTPYRQRRQTGMSHLW